MGENELRRMALAMMSLQLFCSLSSADQQGFDQLQTMGKVELSVPISIAKHLANYGEFQTDLGKARLLNGGNAVLGLALSLRDAVQPQVQAWYVDHQCSRIQL